LMPGATTCGLSLRLIVWLMKISIKTRIGKVSRQTDNECR
jgi:hypothetical protein